MTTKSTFTFTTTVRVTTNGIFIVKTTKRKKNMKVIINKSKYSGTINVPSSKSYSHRYLIAAMLSENSSVVSNIYYSNDI